MSRHHDKAIARAQAEQAAAGRTERPAEPMTRQQIESFVAGFGLSAAAQRQIVSRWTEDHNTAWSTGFDVGYQDGADIR